MAGFLIRLCDFQGVLVGFLYILVYLSCPMLSPCFMGLME